MAKWVYDFGDGKARGADHCDGLHSPDMAELLVSAPFRLNFVPLTEKNLQTTETNSLCGASGQVS
jgi:hypothetical protein